MSKEMTILIEKLSITIIALTKLVNILLEENAEVPIKNINELTDIFAKLKEGGQVAFENDKLIFIK